MSWTDQNPQAEDVLLVGKIYDRDGNSAHFEIDCVHKTNAGETIWNSYYRATIGNLFGSQEIARHKNLDHLLRYLSIEVAKGRFK